MTNYVPILYIRTIVPVHTYGYQPFSLLLSWLHFRHPHLNAWIVFNEKPPCHTQLAGNAIFIYLATFGGV